MYSSLSGSDSFEDKKDLKDSKGSFHDAKESTPLMGGSNKNMEAPPGTPPLDEDYMKSVEVELDFQQVDVPKGAVSSRCAV